MPVHWELRAGRRREVSRARSGRLSFFRTRRIGMLGGLVTCALLPISTVFPAGGGGKAGAFLRLGIGAEPVAMGGAFAAVANTVYSVHFNPAALISVSGPKLAASYALLPLDRQLSFLGFATSVGPRSPSGKEVGGGERPRAGVGVAWIRAGVEEIDGRDLDGRHTGMLSNSENAFVFGFALEPRRGLALGIAGKVLYNRFPGLMEDGSAVTSQGFGLDIGAYAEPFRGFSLGLCVDNLNAHYTWNTQGLWEHGSTKTDRFPRGWRLGAAYRDEGKRAMMLLQLEGREGSDLRWATGGEWVVFDGLSLRVGIRRNRPGIGLGVAQKLFGREFALDYALFAEPEAPGADHWFGWQLEF